MPRESKYEKDLKGRIRRMLPGCEIFKNDPTSRQGVPDLLILYNNKWAMLEVKISESADHRPNQDYYVEHYNNMAFCAFVYPENEEEVLLELQRSLTP